MNDPLTGKIIGAAIEVHRALGPGLIENVYEEALCHEFDIQNIHYLRQAGVDFIYKGKRIKGQRLDLLVENQVVVELKSLQRLPNVVTAQVLGYLKATGLKRGLVINFGNEVLKQGIKRISN